MTTLSPQHTPLCLVLEGPLDALEVEIKRPRFDALIQEHQDVVLDFSQVCFIDSSGIGAVVFLFKRLRALERSLTITGVHGQPLELFRHLHVDRSINVRPLQP